MRRRSNVNANRSVAQNDPNVEPGTTTAEPIDALPKRGQVAMRDTRDPLYVPWRTGLRADMDPRRGDIEDDASSTKRRSLLSLMGSLLAEISLPKLLVAWLVLIIGPVLMLGVAPIVVSVWLGKISSTFTSALAEVWPAILLIIVAAAGWVGGRPLLRAAENSFWALNSLAVQPVYMAGRETLRHFGERLLSAKAGRRTRSRLRAGAALVSGGLMSAVAVMALIAAWPHADLFAGIGSVEFSSRLALVAVANSVVLVAAYLAVAALVWAVGDATLDQPRDRKEFAPGPGADRTWRVAHLSDLHVVGERYGFRIESGRSGPRGNERLAQLLAELARIHAADPLDAIVITGDLTDAGRSSEWAEFLDAAMQHPALAERMLMVPGNHDLNIVDRANPARLDLPTSPNKRLRRLRMLFAMDVLHGERVRVVDRSGRRLGKTLAQTLAPHRRAMNTFADAGRPRLSSEFTRLWATVFPLMLPPQPRDGLGIALLDSNADTHFSFTNALGMVSADQVHALEIARAQYPHACWVIALHHHVVEYPRPAKALSERVGTALINGNWFIRRLRSWAGQAILMHGHRHVDWMGECNGVAILSAPSPVMEATDEEATCFYIHTLAVGDDRRLKLLRPQRVTLEGQPKPPG
jgi:3',5'-cyclic AMP phosphodiesterase CpdA